MPGSTSNSCCGSVDLVSVKSKSKKSCDESLKVDKILGRTGSRGGVIQVPKKNLRWRGCPRNSHGFPKKNHHYRVVFDFCSFATIVL